MPVDAEFQQAAEQFAGEIPENYTVTLFGQAGKLVLADIVRRDRKDVMQAFWKQLETTYHLDKQIWKSEKRVQTTATGNRISEAVSIYDTGTLFIVVHESHILPAEERLEDGANVAYELRLLSRAHNEGLTGEALIESTKAGIR